MAFKPGASQVAEELELARRAPVQAQQGGRVRPLLEPVQDEVQDVLPEWASVVASPTVAASCCPGQV
jgi:hypothetical protein